MGSRQFKIADNWRTSAREQLARTQRFAAKADGFSPVRPHQKILRRAEAVIDAIEYDFLPTPYVTASADGGITFEWRRPNSRLTINVPASRDTGYYGARNSMYKTEGELPEDKLRFINEVILILLVR